MAASTETAPPSSMEMASSAMAPSAETTSSSGVASVAAALASAGPPGVIPPSALIIGDIEAAAAGSKDPGFGYIGVWAKDAAGCDALGTPMAANFAIITKSAYRAGMDVASGTFGPMTDGKVSLQAGDKTVALEQTSPDALGINGVVMVRCKP